MLSPTVAEGQIVAVTTVTQTLHGGVHADAVMSVGHHKFGTLHVIAISSSRQAAVVQQVPVQTRNGMHQISRWMPKRMLPTGLFWVCAELPMAWNRYLPSGSSYCQRRQTVLCIIVKSADFVHAYLPMSQYRNEPGMRQIVQAMSSGVNNCIQRKISFAIVISSQFEINCRAIPRSRRRAIKLFSIKLINRHIVRVDKYWSRRSKEHILVQIGLLKTP